MQQGLDPIETASRDEIAALQRERIAATLHHAYANVAHTSAAFEAAGVHPDDFRQLDDLARFPFTTEARQSRLDLIYVYYRKGEKDTAVDAADQFLREEPTNPRDDYAWYMKGLIFFERTPYSIERFFGVDMARKPPTDILKSINAFSTVVTRYPNSEYAHDALRRMIYLRNRLAQYDIVVARYYVKRGAYLAAAQRANEVVEQYDGSPAERDALAIMLDCYRRLGLKDLAANVQRTYQYNYPQGSRTAEISDNQWWKFWRF